MEEIPSKYSPEDVEPKWLKYWDENEYYKADPSSSKPPFSLVMPPPQCNGHSTYGPRIRRHSPRYFIEI